MIFGLSDLCSADLQFVKAKGVTAAVGTATHSAVLDSGRMRLKFDKWLLHNPFLCNLAILLTFAEGAAYGSG